MASIQKMEQNQKTDTFPYTQRLILFISLIKSFSLYTIPDQLQKILAT